MRNLVSVVAVLMIVSCIPAFSSADEYMNAIENKQRGFAIYARTDGATEESPVITADDIITYNWSDHTFTLKPEAQTKMPGSTAIGRQFTVVVDGKPAYVGTFVSPLASMAYRGPVIATHPPLEKDGFYRIELGYPSQAVTRDTSDPRWNLAVKNALKKAGKLVAEEYPIIDLMLQEADIVAHIKVVGSPTGYVAPKELPAVPGSEIKAVVCEVVQPVKGKIDHGSKITSYYYKTLPSYGAGKPLMEMDNHFIVFLKHSSVTTPDGAAYIVIDRWVGALPYDKSLKDYLAGSAR